MTVPTLFDAASEPRARTSDPKPSHDAIASARAASAIREAARPSDPPASHEAARKTAASRKELHRAIRDVCEDSKYALTQYEIAERVIARYPRKNWKRQTVRSACSGARLTLVDKFGGMSPDDSRCGTYTVHQVVDVVPRGCVHENEMDDRAWVESERVKAEFL